VRTQRENSDMQKNYIEERKKAKRHPFPCIVGIDVRENETKLERW
jgi:hypothetical protein